MADEFRRNLNATSLRGETRAVVLVGQADECPRCHHKVLPKQYLQILRTEAQDSDIEEVCQCTNAACGALFIAVFMLAQPGPRPEYRYNKSIPREPSPPPVPPEVAALSTMFVQVYAQAFAAEAAGLDQLTGIGLRKALEFLVKDFAIVARGEAERDAISRKMLGPCIADYVSDPSVQAVATRAAWLGNDETHYVRKWETKDINDLKTLIRLTMNGIDNVLLAKKYVDDMPVGKK